MGVWIETLRSKKLEADLLVTPCMGVWIETLVVSLGHLVSMSHPVWVCGLKPTSFTPRWFKYGSHPVWVCGLKHNETIYKLDKTRSHPVWVCGLKRKRHKEAVRRF